MTPRQNEILVKAENFIKDNGKEKNLFFIEKKNDVFIAYCYEGRKIAEDSELEKIKEKCKLFSKNADCQFIIDDMTV